MNTSVTTKFAALALALFANSVLLGGVAYVFNARQMAATPVAIETVRLAAVVA